MIQNAIRVITVGFEIPMEMGQNDQPYDFFFCILA